MCGAPSPPPNSVLRLKTVWLAAHSFRDEKDITTSRQYRAILGALGSAASEPPGLTAGAIRTVVQVAQRGKGRGIGYRVHDTGVATALEAGSSHAIENSDGKSRLTNLSRRARCS